MTFAIKKDDTHPPLIVQLKADGHPVDLTGATVVFNMWLKSDESVKITAGATSFVTDGADGKVQYDFSATDTNTVGDYEGEFQVTFGGGAIGTWPPDDDDNIPIKVAQEIAT